MSARIPCPNCGRMKPAFAIGEDGKCDACRKDEARAQAMGLPAPVFRKPAPVETAKGEMLMSGESMDDLKAQRAALDAKFAAAEHEVLGQIEALHAEYRIADFFAALLPLVRLLPDGSRARRQGDAFLQLLANGPKAFTRERAKRAGELGLEPAPATPPVELEPAPDDPAPDEPKPDEPAAPAGKV